MATNERLREAIANARLDIDTIARRVGVNPKTVERWLAGRVPHPQHRWAVADLLGVPDDAIWPGATVPGGGSPVTSEIVAAYTHRADAPLHLWASLIERAERQIDLLAYAMLFLPEQHPGLTEILKTKGAASCQVRVLLGDPGCGNVLALDEEEGFDGAFPARIRATMTHFRDLPGCEGIDLRFHTTPLYSSIYRFDDEMLVNPHLFGSHAYNAPLFHLRRMTQGGILDGYAMSFQRIWDSALPASDWPPSAG